MKHCWISCETDCFIHIKIIRVWAFGEGDSHDNTTLSVLAG